MHKSLSALGVLVVVAFSPADALAADCNLSLEDTSTLVADLIECVSGLQRELEVVMDANKTLRAELEELRNQPQPTLEQGAAFPRGVVVGFRSECPDRNSGWQPFREGTGRFLVGAGEQTMAGFSSWRDELGISHVLRTFEVLDKGGDPEVILKPEHMPSHAHRLSKHEGGGQADALAGSNAGFGIAEVFDPRPDTKKFEKTIESSGDGESHENMPPYIAVNFCEFVGTSQ